MYVGSNQEVKDRHTENKEKERKKRNRFERSCYGSTSPFSFVQTEQREVWICYKDDCILNFIKIKENR